jgi:long-chain acyl-CoA synthetase
MFSFKARKDAPTFKAYDRIESVSDIIDSHLPVYGNRAGIRYDTGDTYVTVSFADYLDAVRSMIHFFTEMGIESKVVATYCKNRLEWDMVGMATMYRGNAIFPLDTKTHQPELEHLLMINPPDYMLVSKAQLPKVRQLLDRLGLSTILIVADYTDTYEDQRVTFDGLREGEISVAEIVKRYDPKEAISPSPQLARNPNIVLGHYPTSGTTALPKIVMISNDNIVHEINEAVNVVNLRPNEDMLNLGPYTHIGTLVEWLMTKTRGFTVTYFTREADEDDVLEDEIEKMKKLGVRVKCLLGVPKLWIYLMKEVLEEMKNRNVFNDLYSYLLSIEKNSKLHDIGNLEKAKLAGIKLLLKNKLGGYFSYGISSSMKLDAGVVEIFGKLGITIIDVYGATEATGIISRNKLNELYPGTSGKIIEPLNCRLVDEETVPGIASKVGMIEIKGRTVSRGYLGERENSHLNDDGYYNTGDLGWIDDLDCVNLVGRKKELTRWHDGSYIDPQYLSNLMVRNIFIKDALVTHLNKEDEFLTVYVYPDKTRIMKDPRWKRELKAGLTDNQIFRRRVEDAIDYAQSIATVPAPLGKDKIFVLPRKLMRTPTHKIKFMYELTRLNEAQPIEVAQLNLDAPDKPEEAVIDFDWGLPLPQVV